jgi:hypothetical protein
MNNREIAVVMVLHEDPVPDAGEILAGIAGKEQFSGRFSANLTFSV